LASFPSSLTLVTLEIWRQQVVASVTFGARALPDDSPEPSSHAQVDTGCVSWCFTSSLACSPSPTSSLE